MAPAFTPREVDASYTDKINTTVAKQINALETRLTEAGPTPRNQTKTQMHTETNAQKNLQPSAEIDYKKFVTRSSLDTILQLLFNYDAPKEQLDHLTEDRIKVFSKRLIAETLNPFSMQVQELPNVTQFQRNVKEARTATEGLAEDIMVHMEKNPESSQGFTKLLMEMRGPNDTQMTRQQIKDQIRLFVFAGHDTTAHTLTWSFHEILANPQIKKKLTDLARNGDQKKTDEYIDQIWNESLRLHMPITFLQRTAHRDLVLGDEAHGNAFNIKKGATLMLDTMSMQRREDLWGIARTGYPANEFHPERFSPENLAAHHLTMKDMETFAFGSGPRVCIGAYLARAEARRIIGEFYKNFDAEALPGKTSITPTNQQISSAPPVIISKFKP